MEVGWDSAGTPPLSGSWVQESPSPTVLETSASCLSSCCTLHSRLPFSSPFLAELFFGLSLTSTAKQAHSDKALKSSACISHSGWAQPSWTGAEYRTEVGLHVLEAGPGEAQALGSAAEKGGEDRRGQVSPGQSAECSASSAQGLPRAWWCAFLGSSH